MEGHGIAEFTRGGLFPHLRTGQTEDMNVQTQIRKPAKPVQSASIDLRSPSGRQLPF